MGLNLKIIGILVLQLLFNWTCFISPCLAEELPGQASTALDLDLSSSERTVAASEVLGSAAQATINLAGIAKTVLPADMLTASEMIAVRQVVNTGTQYLHLDELGIANGGGFHISYYAANGIGNLVIPEGVRASQNAALLQTLNLTGNLTNSGTFNVFSSDTAVTSATVNAANICNNAGANITSTLASLTLNAVNNIVNSGTIASTGSVAMTAGGSITNSGIIQALQNLTVQATSVSNQAQMAATLGSVNVVTANLISAGLIQSAAGQVNTTPLTNSINSSISILNTFSTNASSISASISVNNTSSTSGAITSGGTILIASGSAGSTSLNIDAGSSTGANSTTLLIIGPSNNTISGNNSGATTLSSNNQPIATKASSTEVSSATATFIQPSTTTTQTVNDGNFISRPVISTDITAVTPLAIFQQLPASTTSVPVASTMMHTINALNQINMIPSTIQSIGPFSMSPPNSPNAPQSPSASPGMPMTQSPFQKIAYTSGAPGFNTIENSAKELSEIQFDTCLVRHSGNSDISYQHGTVCLHNGEILVHSPQQTRVVTDEYSITVAPGSVALITKQNNVLKVRALYEAHANSIAIAAENNTIKLSVGQEVMIAPNSVHLRAANLKDDLGRRRIVGAVLSNGHAMSRSEFSHVGLIEQADVLTKLFHSNAPHDRQLSGKLLKMAACLMTVTGSHGAYSDK